MGGVAAQNRNVISGNARDGVRIEGAVATGNAVRGNYIGIRAVVGGAIGNGGCGVVLASSAADNAVGGASAGAGNTIAYSGDTGVLAHASAARNSILRNGIFANANLGIDLAAAGSAADGVAANDAGDPDTGGNNLQNFPTLDKAASGGSVVSIKGSLNSAPNTQYTLQFFSSAAADPSGYGEGETYLGAATVATDAAGNASFTLTFPVAVAPGKVISATATDPANNTSEFSATVTAIAAPDVAIAKAHAGSFVVGAEGEYTLTVTNVGTTATTDPITVTDVLPTGLGFISASGTGWTVAAVGQTVTATRISALAPGESSIVKLTVAVASAAAPSVTNTASVSTFGDGGGANDSASDPTAVQVEPVLTLSVTADLRDRTGAVPNPARTTATVSDIIIYSITARNVGDDDAHDIVLYNTLPPKVALEVGSLGASLPAGLAATVAYSNDGGATWAYTPVANPQGVDPGVTTIRWTFAGTLLHTAPNNQSAVSLRTVVQPGVSTGIEALGDAHVDYKDGAGAMRPRACGSSAVRLAAPAVSLEPDRAVQAMPGAAVVFPHTVTNMGVISDTFNITSSASENWPVTFYRDVSGDGQLDAGDTPLTDTTGDGTPDTGVVAAGASIGVLVRVHIPEGCPATALDTITLVARAFLENVRSDAATDRISLASGPLLKTEKYIQAPGTTRSSAKPGKTVTYGIRLSNIGGSAATNTVATDSVPLFARYVAGSTRLDGVVVAPDPYAAATRTIVVTVGAVPAGGSATITFQVVVR